jgi:hypothetical protein
VQTAAQTKASTKPPCSRWQAQQTQTRDECGDDEDDGDYTVVAVPCTVSRKAGQDGH